LQLRQAFWVRCVLKTQKTTISVIPGGCTGFVQVLDVSLNKPLKDLIKEEQDNHYDRYIENEGKKSLIYGSDKSNPAITISNPRFLDVVCVY